jgi:acyl-CoA dehydrogenase
MTFALTAEQQEIRTAVSRLSTGFGDEYWLARDDDSSFPHEFHGAIAEAGWLGIATSEAYRGSGLGRPLAASSTWGGPYIRACNFIADWRACSKAS